MFTLGIQVGVGTTTPNASSALDVTSTTKGFLMPRMTTSQRTAIATPANGLQVYDTDTNSQWFYNGTVWVQGATSATDNTNDSWVDNAGNTVLSSGKVGIGTLTPSWDLQVTGAFDGDIAAIPGSLGGKPTIRAINFQGKQTQITTTDGTATVPINGVTAANLSMLYSNADNLLIRQDTPTGKIYFSTNGTVRQTILDNGNVGIGTMDPISKLHIDETTGQSNLYLTNSTTGNPYIQFSGGSYFMNSSGQFMQNANGSKHIFKNAGQTYLNITDSGLAVNKGDDVATAAVDVNGYVKVGSVDTIANATPTAGLIRFNSTTSKFEGYDGTIWVAFH